MSARRITGFPERFLEVRASPVDGRGVFARCALPARRKLGELDGELVRMRATERRVARDARIFLVELDGGVALDCRRSNGFRHLNHRCEPNAYLRAAGRCLEVYTLRRVRAGEELTIDYVATPHRGGMVCRCGATTCRGVL